MMAHYVYCLGVKTYQSWYLTKEDKRHENLIIRVGVTSQTPYERAKQESKNGVEWHLVHDFQVENASIAKKIEKEIHKFFKIQYQLIEGHTDQFDIGKHINHDTIINSMKNIKESIVNPSQDLLSRIEAEGEKNGTGKQVKSLEKRGVAVLIKEFLTNNPRKTARQIAESLALDDKCCRVLTTLYRCGDLSRDGNPFFYWINTDKKEGIPIDTFDQWGRYKSALLEIGPATGTDLHKKIFPDKSKKSVQQYCLNLAKAGFFVVVGKVTNGRANIYDVADTYKGSTPSERPPEKESPNQDIVPVKLIGNYTNNEGLVVCTFSLSDRSKIKVIRGESAVECESMYREYLAKLENVEKEVSHEHRA